MINNTFPCYAKVYAWRYKVSLYNGPSQTGFAGIWRPLNDNQNSYKLIHKTKLYIMSISFHIRIALTTPTGIAVNKGDVVGFHTSSDTIGPVSSWTFDGNYDNTDYFDTFVIYGRDNHLPVGKIIYTSALIKRPMRIKISALMERPGM